jgi:hypothetical protein
MIRCVVFFEREGPTMSNNELAPISPGQYRTRCGIVAIVSESSDKLHPPFYWAGTAAGEIEVWDRHGRYYGNSQDSPLDLVARLPDEPPADDRIERALQVLRNACDESDDGFGGWDLVRQGIKILEGRE